MDAGVPDDWFVGGRTELSGQRSTGLDSESENKTNKKHEGGINNRGREMQMHYSSCTF